jgi:hypothetical protein
MPTGFPLSRSARQERDAARAARNDNREELLLLLAALTRPDHPLHHKASWHRAKAARASAHGAMNFVVCIHIRTDWEGTGEVTERQLAWMMGDFQIYDYFAHLELRDCAPSKACTREEKMRLLARLASR